MLKKLLDFPKFRDQTFEIKYLVPKFEMFTKYFSFPFLFSATGKLRSLVSTVFGTRSKVLIMVFLALKSFNLVIKVVGTDFVTRSKVLIMVFKNF